MACGHSGPVRSSRRQVGREWECTCRVHMPAACDLLLSAFAAAVCCGWRATGVLKIGAAGDQAQRD